MKLKKVFLILICVFLVVSCSKKDKGTNSTPDPTEEIKNRVEKLYTDWARFSRLHAYSSMLSLVVPNSNFEGMSNTCNEQWGRGEEFYYVFTSVEVDYVSQDPIEMNVHGNWEMHQGPSVPVYKGGFYSNAWPIDGEFEGHNWKLDGMNMNLDENWWK